MTEINIIKFDGKPLEKLIDVISKGIGTVYTPRGIRKEAEAKAYKIELIERAKSKAMVEGKELEAETLFRINERFIHKETKRQNNIDNVTQVAVEQLKDETEVSDEPVDEDWASRFFNIVEDINNEDMQALWGRILAGEVKKPKSYSLRTLELLKNLNKDEAELFIRFAKLALIAPSGTFVHDPDNGATLRDKYNITFSDRLTLVEAGLIATENNLEFSYKPLTEKVKAVLLYGKKGFFIEREAGAPETSITCFISYKSRL